MSSPKKILLAHQVGKAGEAAAQEYLQQQSISILDRNIKLKQYEIDLIGWQNKELLIIEVKSSLRELRPSIEGFVIKKQQKNLIKATQHYLEKKNLQPMSIRYDLILISYALIDPKVSHIKNAFHPFLI